MFDTLSIKFPLTHSPVGGKNVTRTADGPKRVWYPKRLIDIGHPSQRLLVQSLKEGRWIKIENSYLGALQGHNICGPNNLEMIARRTLTKVVERLGMDVDERAIERSLRGAVIKRLHMAVGFKLQSESQASALLKVASEQIRATVQGMVRTYGEETLYISRAGRTVVIYNKGREVAAKKEKQWEAEGRSEFAPLLRYARNLVRFELRLDEKWLRDHKLIRLCDWNDERVKASVQEELQQLGLDREVKFISAADYAELPKRVCRFLMAQASQVPLEAGYSERAIRSLRSDAAKKGIFLGYAPGVNTRPAMQLLTRERMRCKYPKRFRRAGLVVT